MKLKFYNIDGWHFYKDSNDIFQGEEKIYHHNDHMKLGAHYFNKNSLRDGEGLRYKYEIKTY